MRDDFKADLIQIAQLVSALSSDNNGNLVFRDEFIPEGVTLSELLGDGTGGSGSKTHIEEIVPSQWTPTSYSFGSENTYMGYEFVINHKLNLKKNKFLY